MRKKQNYKREHKPDMIHGSIAVGRFINYLMEDGKKAVAEKIMYETFDLIKKNSKEDPKEVFDKAMANAAPAVEISTRRVGGANYQVPVEVRPERMFILAAR